MDGFKSDEKVFYSGFKDKKELTWSLESPLPKCGKVIKVKCGWREIFILTDNGCFVWNKQNSLKNTDVWKNIGKCNIKDIDSGDTFSIFITHESHVFQFKNDAINCTSIIPISYTPHVEKVSCGKEHVLLLTNEGLVYSFGLGSRGQLGHANIEKEDKPKVIEALQGIKIKQISAGGWHSCALSDIGDLYIWGWNESGQLGLPCEKLKNNTKNDMECFKYNAPTQIVNIQSTPHLLESIEENITSVSCGSRHTAAITESGKVWTWGWNAYGQLGLKDDLIIDKPVQIQFFKGFHGKNVHCSEWITLISDYS